MTIDLKWILPSTAPFIVAALFRPICWFTGATYEPDLAAAAALILGAIAGFISAVPIHEAGPVWPIRIGKKGDNLMEKYDGN